MKEIIYLDIKLVNSLLAQLDQGLILKQISEENSSQSNTEELGNQETIATEGKAGIPFLSGNISGSTTDIDKTSIVYSFSNRELLETAIDDFSLDLLLDKITCDIKKLDESQEGDFVKNTDNFSIFDFSYLKNVINIDSLKPFIPDQIAELEKLKKELKSISKQNKEKHKARILEITTAIDESVPNLFNNISAYSIYMDSLFENCVLVKVGKAVNICEKENIRIPKSTLSLLNNTKRKTTILGIVASEIDNNNNFDDFATESPDKIISHGPNAFISITTKSFNLVNDGDYFVRPIAIYFE
ncbi:DUF6414 family protein [Streptococcus intermedius]